MDPAHNATDPAMTRSTYFTFTAPSPPPLDFTFLPEPVPTYTGKRARPVGLSDTDDHPITKKRRLRLDLITSRLSSPFAVPATNIGVRIPRPSGGRRRVGSGVLRKAAILNKIRRDAAVKRMEQEKKVEAARREFRERLAAAAHSSFQRSGVVRFHRRRVCAPHTPPRAPSPPPSEDTCITTAYPQPLFATFFDDGSESGREKDVDPSDSFYWPPSPPSEAELNRQRRGMGLDIGCC